jgi:leader peptidase (prepilin peptidase)/N-methyltransferase
MTILISIFVLILGASVGSFLSVVIHRLCTQKKGIFFGHSCCTACNKKLKSKDLIPIISYILLKGKCRYCKKTFSVNYLYLEILTALVFLAIFLKFNFIAEDFAQGNYAFNGMTFLFFVLNVIYAAFLLAIFFYDLQFSQIPDVLLFPFIAIALVGSLIIGQPGIISMIIAVVIALAVFGGQILVSKGKWLGDGDLYLSLGLALIFGWQLFLIAIVVTYFIGAIAAAFLILSKKAKLKTAVPFAPFLVLGSLITVFFGQELITWYSSILII